MSSNELFDEETKQALKQIFQQFKKKVVDYLIVEDSNEEKSREQIHAHNYRHGCPTCEEAKRLAEAIMEISRGMVEFKIITKSNEEAKQLKPRYTPAFIYGAPARNIRFYGLPSGQEFAPFIYVHQYIANNEIKLPDHVVEEARRINVPLHIKIFVTPECPYCPLTVDAFNQLALVNDKLLVETIEALELQLEADMYNVAYVPDVVITDPDKKHEYGAEPIERISGYMPIEEAIKIVLYAAEKLKELKKNM